MRLNGCFSISDDFPIKNINSTTHFSVDVITEMLDLLKCTSNHHRFLKGGFWSLFQFLYPRRYKTTMQVSQ